MNDGLMMNEEEGSARVGLQSSRGVPAASAYAPHGRPTQADLGRGIVALLVFCAWMLSQLHSDVAGLLGHTPLVGSVEERVPMKRNAYFPLPELSMFAEPTRHYGFELSLIIVVSVYCGFLMRMWLEMPSAADIEAAEDGRKEEVKEEAHEAEQLVERQS